MNTKSPSLPMRCATALKEWASVLQAMDRGEQLVLIRKGGLIEPGSGFEVVNDIFVFYPTFEHQAVNYLREDYRGYFEQASRARAPEGSVRFECFGTAVSTHSVNEPALIKRLEAFHIFNEAFVTQRLKWQPDAPMVLVIVRVYRLAQPQMLPVDPSYAGCKSWVELKTSVLLEQAIPVLSDAVFRERLQQLEAIL